MAAPQPREQVWALAAADAESLLECALRAARSRLWAHPGTPRGGLGPRAPPRGVSAASPGRGLPAAGVCGALRSPKLGPQLLQI